MNGNRKWWLLLATVGMFSIMLFNIYRQWRHDEQIADDSKTMKSMAETLTQTREEMSDYARQDRERVEKAVKAREAQMHELKAEIHRLHDKQ